MLGQKLFSYLKCIKCGTKELEIIQYKRHGVIPTCRKCRRRFQMWTYAKIPTILLILGFIIVTIILLVFLYYLGVSGSEFEQITLYWVLRLLPYSISLLVIIIVISILRRKYGSKLIKYFEYTKEGKLKSETDNEWYPYKEWIKSLLLERNISEVDIFTCIENEIIRQDIIKATNLKRGKFFSRFGYSLLILAIISLIYGLAVSLEARSTGEFLFIFTTRHLVPSLVTLVLGFLLLIIGIPMKKFYNMQ